MGDMIKCSKCCTYHYMNDPCVEFDVEPSFYCPQCLQDSTDSELQENEGYCRLCCQQNQQDLFLKDVLSTELEAARAANLTYHDRTELSSTQVAKFMDDPIAFYEMHVTGERKREAPTEAMKFGTSVHEMIELGGPDKMPIAVIPREVLNKDGHKRGKAWTQWKAEQPDDALLYKEGEAIPWTKIWVSLLANEECVPWLASDRKEEEFYWQDSASGLQCRAKLDVVDASKIVDWKTTRSVDPRGFQSACHSMHYAERRLALPLRLKTAAAIECNRTRFRSRG